MRRSSMLFGLATRIKSLRHHLRLIKVMFNKQRSYGLAWSILNQIALNKVIPSIWVQVIYLISQVILVIIWYIWVCLPTIIIKITYSLGLLTMVTTKALIGTNKQLELFKDIVITFNLIHLENWIDILSSDHLTFLLLLVVYSLLSSSSSLWFYLRPLWNIILRTYRKTLKKISNHANEQNKKK